MSNCDRQNEHLLKHFHLSVHLSMSMVQKKKLHGFSPICINCPLSLQKQGVAASDEGGADVTYRVCGSAGNQINLY